MEEASLLLRKLRRLLLDLAKKAPAYLNNPDFDLTPTKKLHTKPYILHTRRTRLQIHRPGPKIITLLHKNKGP